MDGTDEGVSAAPPHQLETNENNIEQEESKNNFVNQQHQAAAGVILNQEQNMEMEDDDEDDEDQSLIQIDEQQNLKQRTQEQESQLESLRDQALKFKEYWDKFNLEFETSEGTSYFLLSKKWLKHWKKHVSYDRVVKGLEPNYEYFAKQGDKLLNANLDLIQTTVSDSSDEYYEYHDQNQSGNTIILKPQLKESVNYIIVDRDIVNLFENNYQEFKLIPRRTYKTPDGKKRIEIYYRKINLVIINHSLLKDIDNSKVKELVHKKIQVFSRENQEEFKHFLCPIVKKHQHNQYYTPSSNSGVTLQTIRLWKLNENDTIKNVYQKIHEATRKFSSFEYKLKSPFVFIERNNDNTVDDLNITEDSTIFVELSKQSGFTFKLEGEPDEDQCEFCRNYKILKFECRCKKVKYCSDSCKLKDQEYHARVCNMAGEDSEEEDQAVANKFENDSIRGLCGLQNLGNTCFMNSALQCMSNTIPLTKYFLKKIYNSEINETNVLGTQGKLAKQYGKFIKNVWTNNSRTFSPIALKMAVARLQSMFSGYQQHDSQKMNPNLLTFKYLERNQQQQNPKMLLNIFYKYFYLKKQEFLSYILDGLHEDLNRVKQKKYTESIDSNGRPDSVVSKESWLNHLKRNQSVIVDLMQGQFKSKVTCPDCSKESITFDPFLTCSLPIPNQEVKILSLYLIYANNKKMAVEVKYTYQPNSNQTLKDLKTYISLKHELQTSHLTLYHLSFDRVLDQFSDNLPLEEIRKTAKSSSNVLMMIEYDEDLTKEDEYIKIPFLFAKLKEESYMNSTVKNTFTFVRPFLIKKSANKKDLHLTLFQYIKPILERVMDSDSEFNQDAKQLPLDKLYEKYILTDNPPYKLTIESDAQDYIDRPCSWCKNTNCKNCQVPYNDEEDPMEEYTNRSKSHYYTFRFECVIDQSNEIGRLINNLHQADRNKNSDQKYENNDTKTDIYECLKLFEQPEKLGEDNEWYCPECKKHQKAQKQIVIYRAPEILILHLKRFKGSGGLFKSKLTKIVDFPITELDMTDFVVEKETPLHYYVQDEEYFKEVHINPPVVPASQSDHIESEFNNMKQVQLEFEQESNNNQNDRLEEEQKNNSNSNSNSKTTNTKASSSNMDIETETGNQQKLLYDLYAITNHYGSLGFGHYTAFANNNNKWYCFDDSSVRTVSEGQLVSEASYILFYKRRQ